MPNWPTVDDYCQALIDAPACLAASLGGNVEIICDQEGRQITRRGDGSIVFKARIGASSAVSAIKCFLRPQNHLKYRYMALVHEVTTGEIADYFPQHIRFVEKGISINQYWFPIVAMDWIDGDTIHDYARDSIASGKAARLFHLADALLEMEHKLAEHGLSHGDLSNSNLLVERTAANHLKLVDLDGIYVDSLSKFNPQLPSSEHFQHPHRDSNHFGADTDRFAFWIIYASLMAFAIDPDLWRISGADRDPDRLLFTRNDFNEPQLSPTLAALRCHHDRRLQNLSISLDTLLLFGMHQIPRVSRDLRIVFPSDEINLAPTASYIKLDAVARDIVDDFTHTIMPCRIFAGITVLSLAIFAILQQVYAAHPLYLVAAAIALFVIDCVAFALLYRHDHAVLTARNCRDQHLAAKESLMRLHAETQLCKEKKSIVDRKISMRRNNLSKQAQDLSEGETYKIKLEATSLADKVKLLEERLCKVENLEKEDINRCKSSDEFILLAELDRALRDSVHDESQEMEAEIRENQLKNIDHLLAGKGINEANILPFPVMYELSQNGYRNAADVLKGDIYQVAGITEKRAAMLLDWANRCAAEVLADQPRTISRTVRLQIEAHYLDLRDQLEAQKWPLQQKFDIEVNAIFAKYSNEKREVMGELSGAKKTFKAAEDRISKAYETKLAELNRKYARELNMLDGQLRDFEQELDERFKQVYLANEKLAKSVRTVASTRKLTFAFYLQRVFALARPSAG